MAMTSTLTISERQIGFGLTVALALLGLAMAGVARQGQMTVHGGMALIATSFYVLQRTARARLQASAWASPRSAICMAARS